MSSRSRPYYTVNSITLKESCIAEAFREGFGFEASPPWYWSMNSAGGGQT